MRLLLVEDEEKTTYLSRALGESGFTVDISADGAGAFITRWSSTTTPSSWM
jgi:DNA-binding response OmpR family regulator